MDLNLRSELLRRCCNVALLLLIFVPGVMHARKKAPRRWTYDEQKHPRINVSTFGLFNSGTNLLQSMLFNANRNLSVCPVSGQSKWRGELSCKHKQPWKHGHPSRVKAWLESKPVVDGQISVFIVRNPFSLLEATRRHWYDLKVCFKKSSWLRKPCNCNSISGPNRLYFCAKDQKSFKSAIDIWNVFASGYVKIAEHVGYPRVVAVVRYEDLVLAPDVAFTDISAIIGQRLDEGAFQLSRSRPAKPTSVGYMAAAEKMTRQSYLKTYTEDMARFACAELDPGLMKRFGYDTDCQTLEKRDNAGTT